MAQELVSFTLMFSFWSISTMAHQKLNFIWMIYIGSILFGFILELIDTLTQTKTLSAEENLLIQTFRFLDNIQTIQVSQVSSKFECVMILLSANKVLWFYKNPGVFVRIHLLGHEWFLYRNQKSYHRLFDFRLWATEATSKSARVSWWRRKVPSWDALSSDQLP